MLTGDFLKKKKKVLFAEEKNKHIWGRQSQARLLKTHYETLPYFDTSAQ